MVWKLQGGPFWPGPLSSRHSISSFGKEKKKEREKKVLRREGKTDLYFVQPFASQSANSGKEKQKFREGKTEKGKKNRAENGQI